MEAILSSTDKGGKRRSSNGIRPKRSSTKSVGSNKSSRKKLSAAASSERKSDPVLTEEEESALVAEAVWQEIVAAAFDRMYENDLDKESVRFVSRCSRLAWRALVEWNWQSRDAGGFWRASAEARDGEPAAASPDAWAGRSVPVGAAAAAGAAAEGGASAAEGARGGAAPEASTASGEPHAPTPSQRARTAELGRELVQAARRRARARSELEPAAGRAPTAHRSVVEPKRDSYELPAPVAMQARYFPPARVEVDYAVAAGARGLLDRRPPDARTVRLRCPVAGDDEAGAA